MKSYLSEIPRLPATLTGAIQRIYSTANATASRKLLIRRTLYLLSFLVGLHLMTPIWAIPGQLQVLFGVLAGNKDSWNAIQSIVASTGIVATAVWFWRRRRRYPRLDLSHIINHSNLGCGYYWVRVEVRIENKGEVIATIPKGLTALQQVLPLRPEMGARISGRDPELLVGTELPWPVISMNSGDIGKLEVEPGECDGIPYDFIISDDIELVIVYTHLANAKKLASGHGWPLRSVYSFIKHAAGAGSTEPKIAPH
jgi:hypothetical protein